MEFFATKVGGHYHALHVFSKIGFFVVDKKCEKLNMMEVLTKKNIFSWGHCGILSTIIKRFVFKFGIIVSSHTSALQLCRDSRFLLKYP